MGGFAGLLAGFGDRARQENLMSLQQKAKQQEHMLSLLGELANNPNIDPQAAEDYHKLRFQIAQTPQEKFDPKKIDVLGPHAAYNERRSQKAAEFEQRKKEASALAAAPVQGAPGLQELGQSILDLPEPPESVYGMVDPRRVADAQFANRQRELEGTLKLKEQAEEKERARLTQEGRAIYGLSGRDLANYVNNKMLPNLPLPPQAAAPVPIPPSLRRQLDIEEESMDPHALSALVSSMGQENKVHQQAINVKLTNGKTVAAAFNPVTGEVTGPKGIIPADQISEYRPREDRGEPLYPAMVNGIPTLVPRSQAKGLPAVRTVYGPEGTPATGGVEGVSVTAPPPISGAIGDKLSALKSTLDQFKAVEPFLKSVKFGPVTGRITMAEVGKIGGMGATPQEQELAIRLDNLLTSRAFADGGKQLTGVELERFQRNTPSPTDTLQQALTKARVATEILNNSFNNRIKALPARQRAQLPPDWRGEPATLPAPPPGGGGAKAATHRYNPATGMIEQVK